MQVIATVYFKRFYARRSYKDVDPLLIACASVFLASKVEEHGLMSTSDLIKTIPNCLKKWPNLTYDASSKNSGLYYAEFLLVKMLDCCLVGRIDRRDCSTRTLTARVFGRMLTQCTVERDSWRELPRSVRSRDGWQYGRHG
ncbi:hypothetical protein ANCCAN_14139 [Ancylostoma caninum]|uniref:Cyclin N-terminal domain-containing protein n=1 Tax=Ancylostoma caninum TaxID=29170 RepID=A0A368G9E9_ANCCA|nr:hypothetical protein ANCCAN_14139 [Ancylostoma caninum]